MDDTCVLGAPPYFTEYAEEQAAEYHVVNTLRELGYMVSILGVDSTVEPILDGLKERQPDIVFNLIETFRFQRKLDGNVAGLLELMGVPFTGTAAVGLTLCRNKGLCKQLLSARRIRVPDFVVIPPGASALRRHQRNQACHGR
jgi:D-alanine-D-alanine ligase